MPRIPVMLNGLPGKMATEVYYILIGDERFSIISSALTGKENLPGACGDFQLLHAETTSPQWWSELKEEYPNLIAVDYTHPSAVDGNARLYRNNGLNFVMGTTGGDRQALNKLFDDGFSNCAVIAPNMAKQIVLFQSMMQFAAERFPRAFAGYTLEITESHQKGKADTSGTAKAMVVYFNALGIPFTESQIKMIRKPKEQLAMGVPKNDLPGHGFHTYTLKSERSDVLFSFTHNVCGRRIYAEGTRDAILFLNEAVANGAKGRVFSMMDVLAAS